jgi:anti-sigma factor RsiW
MMKGLLARLRRVPSCEEVMEILQAYLDGEIDAKRARRVAGHLSVCDRCNTESHVYLDIKASLASRRREIDPQVRAALEAFALDLTEGLIDG